MTAAGARADEPRTADRAEEPPLADRAERRVRRAVAGLVFVVAAYFVPGATWSPVSRFCLTRAIVERGSFEITKDAASTGDRAQVGDATYSDKAPLPAFFAAPLYGVVYHASRAFGAEATFRSKERPGRPAMVVLPNAAFQRGLYACSLSTAALAASALAWSLFGVIRRRTSVRVAALASVTTVLATPLFPYATSFFDHTIAAAALFGAFASVDAPLRVAAVCRRYLAAGLLLGIACGTEYVVTLLALPIGAYGMLVAPRERRRAALLRLAGGAAIPLTAVALYHTVCFGAPFRTGYSFITHPGFAAGQASGFFGLGAPSLEALLGLLASPSRGLFYVAPIALLALYELAREAYRERQRPAFLALAVFATAYLVNACYFQWDGGRALGPRHMVPAMGFLGMGIALAFERRPTVTAVVAGVSVFAIVGATAVGLEVPSRTDVLFDYLAPALRQGRIARAPGASNLGLLLGLGARGSLVALVALVAALSWGTSRLIARCPSESPERGEPQ